MIKISSLVLLCGKQDKKYTFLFEFCDQLMHTVFELLDIKPDIKYSETYEKEINGNVINLRSVVHPKKEADSAFEHPAYQQVFEGRTGFLENMSIIDILFSEGPNTANLLEKQ